MGSSFSPWVAAMASSSVAPAASDSQGLVLCAFMKPGTGPIKEGATAGTARVGPINGVCFSVKRGLFLEGCMSDPELVNFMHNI